MAMIIGILVFSAERAGKGKRRNPIQKKKTKISQNLSMNLRTSEVGFQK